MTFGPEIIPAAPSTASRSTAHPARRQGITPASSRRRIAGHSSHRAVQNHHRGFTLIELVLGMVVTAMVMAALSGVLTAVSQGWSDAQTRHAEFARQNAITARVDAQLQNARRIWQIRPGTGSGNNSSAAIVYCDVDPDGSSTYAVENVHVLMLNTSRHTLEHIQLPAGTFGAYRIPSSMLSSNVIPEAWLSLCNKPIALAGSTLTDGPKITSVKVSGWPSSGPNPPTCVEYVVQVTSNGSVTTNYGTVTLRAPWRQTN